ncbi:hypothetical protein phiAS5_ORF0305 [Aeromonas phage phiAS5]|uniref:Uncharacterized protein n=1 Tax=Aeromonas phage phiAS5 TaxID=879630 RepID=E1A259_9CAUD|nr:hypothetical protein phiAS5_ORF0305 [Aeromonas phage phiAS5]ADM80148.1 hypothetical protein phiAS5_ORF0305 [Aeromonas phage phiAS5]
MQSLKKEIEENVRASFELSGQRVTDTQWEQIKRAAEYINGEMTERPNVADC